MKNKNILIALLLILITFTFFILWLKNIDKSITVKNKTIVTEIINSPNIAIDYDSLPDIDTIDTNTGKNIFQGVAYEIRTDKTTNSIDLGISNTRSNISYYLTAKLQDIQILSNDGILINAA